MGSLLNDVWLRDLEATRTIDDGSVGVARASVRAAGARCGLDTTIVEKAAIAASELTRNQVAHAREGRLAVLSIERDGSPGIELVAVDRGPGIADPSRALRGRGWSGGSLGAGLAAVRRLAIELDIDVRISEGTCIRCRFFPPGVRRRREVGIFARPIDGEPIAGDAAAFVRTQTGLACAIVDGIGHGGLARDAADAAVDAFLDAASESVEAIVAASEARVQGTRGVVIALARIDEEAATVEHASVGNIVVRLDDARSSRSFVGNAGTLSSGGARASRLRHEHAPLLGPAALVAFTDGVTSRASLSGEIELLREHPIVVAQWIIERFGRPSDDALVLVAK